MAPSQQAAKELLFQVLHSLANYQGDGIKLKTAY